MIEKIKVLDGGKGQNATTGETFDIIGPLSVKVGDEISATLVWQYWHPIKEEWIDDYIQNGNNGSYAQYANLSKTAGIETRLAWQLTPEKDIEINPRNGKPAYVTLVKCNCSCHTDGVSMHFVACCENGYNKVYTDIPPEKEGEEKPVFETPNNPRDVLAYVTNCGWMMGNYENGVWRLCFADKGLSVIDNEQDVIDWQELPERPESAKDRTAFTITSPLISLFNVERALYDYWSDLDEEEPNYYNALNAIKNYKDE